MLQHQQQSGYSNWAAQQQAAISASAPLSSPGGFFDSPQSQQPLVSSAPWARERTEDESPASAMGEKVYFSPYSGQYNSPVDANEHTPKFGPEGNVPLDGKGSAGASLSGVVRSSSREKREPEGERIEMQNVAPVLLHPGNGRGRPLAADEDAKTGHAV